MGKIGMTKREGRTTERVELEGCCGEGGEGDADREKTGVKGLEQLVSERKINARWGRLFGLDRFRVRFLFFFLYFSFKVEHVQKTFENLNSF